MIVFLRLNYNVLKNPRYIKLWKRIYAWRIRRIKDKQFIMLLSILIGMFTGVGAVLIKESVHTIRNMLHSYETTYLYFILPGIGIGLAVMFSKFIVRRPIRHGVPNVLYAKGMAKGYMRAHNMFSSIVSSALTVGFGGSVGLEGPTVSTGAAIGSNLGRFLHLRTKQIILLLGCACAGAMAAIFKAPVAAIVFALEVIMLDLTMSSLVPLLLASSSAVLVSYFFTGQDFLYSFVVEESFQLNDLWFYVLLGVICGFVALYFKRIYVFIDLKFQKMTNAFHRVLFGGLILGGMLYVLPALYGEGYQVINAALKGNVDHLFNDTLFTSFKGDFSITIALLIAIILFKVIAAALTFGAGGVGGIFAPTLFMGVNVGLVFSLIVNQWGIRAISISNFALMGMAGMIAGVLHAPLTAIFLIAELSGGYELFVPLMIVATISYATIKMFEKHSVYTYQLASRKELVTHHKDNAMLLQMDVNKLIETDFKIIKPDATLRDLTEAISEAHRNLFPVVDKDGYLKGMVKMDDVRHIIFKQELYDTVFVKDIMYMPEFFISAEDNMESLVAKFSGSGRFNIAVVNEGKYLGFVSRARAFTAYRNLMRRNSED